MFAKPKGVLNRLGCVLSLEEIHWLENLRRRTTERRTLEKFFRSKPSV
jgi:hypothetical protein